VPASLFTTGVPCGEITALGRRIFRAFAGQVIGNVGDILPPTGDIEGVAALGEAVQKLTPQQ
jgi:hypothetical protein